MPLEIWDIEPNMLNSTKLVNPILESLRNSQASYFRGGHFLLSPSYCKKSGKILTLNIFIR